MYARFINFRAMTPLLSMLLIFWYFMPNFWHLFSSTLPKINPFYNKFIIHSLKIDLSYTVENTTLEKES